MQPDDLSPAESIQLQRLLHEVGDGALDVPRGTSEPDDLVERDDSPEAPSKNLLDQGEWMRDFLDLSNGNGCWHGHPFTLPEPMLKKVLATVARRISENLTAEIERLRNEAK